MKQTNLFSDPDLIPNGNEKAHEKSFFNTIHAEGKELQKFQSESKGQELIIMKVFERGEKLTALEVKRRTGINQDSCKRAITNLATKGKLMKLGKDEMVLEQYGKMNHRWQIK